MKIVVEFHDGETMEAFRDTPDAAVDFKVKTLQWGIQRNSQYMSPAKIKGITIVKDSDTPGDTPKRKPSTKRSPARKTREADSAEG